MDSNKEKISQNINEAKFGEQIIDDATSLNYLKTSKIHNNINWLKNWI